MKPLNIPGVSNGYMVDDLIGRGAQPEVSAWPLLAAAGFKAVLDLNNSGDAAIAQAKLVNAAGMFYISRPWNGILPPSQSAVNSALGAIDNRLHVGDVPVFIHCAHGSDRTGTLCAIWRMHHDGWDLDDALAEALTALGTQGMHEIWMAAAVAHYAHGQGALLV